MKKRSSFPLRSSALRRCRRRALSPVGSFPKESDHSLFSDSLGIILTNASLCAILFTSEQSIHGVRRINRRMKREAGASPARTRRCKAGVLRQIRHWGNPGRRRRALIAESEDLPRMKVAQPRVIGRKHASPVWMSVFGLRFGAGFFYSILSFGRMGSVCFACTILPHRPKKG